MSNESSPPASTALSPCQTASSSSFDPSSPPSGHQAPGEPQVHCGQVRCDTGDTLETSTTPELSNRCTVVFSPPVGVLGVYRDRDILQAVMRDLDARLIPYTLYTAQLDGPPLSNVAPAFQGCEECGIGWAIFNIDLEPLPGEDPCLGEVQRCDTCQTMSESAAWAEAQRRGFVLDQHGNILSASAVEAPSRCLACGYRIQAGPQCETCGYPYGKPRRDLVMLDTLGPFRCAPLDLLDRWNGFVKPRFTREEALAVVEALLADPLSTITAAHHDAARDAFVFESTEDGDEGPEIYAALNDGTYAIGAGGWVWTPAEEQ